MQNFYFTFGSNKNFPHQNGYMIVIADGLKEALDAFRKKYPDRTERVLNCSDYYPENQWERLLADGYYTDQEPKEILYANPAQKREMELFGTLLSMIGLEYRTNCGQIILVDENGSEYRDECREIRQFESTTDAINGISWALEFESKGVYFAQEETEKER